MFYSACNFTMKLQTRNSFVLCVKGISVFLTVWSVRVMECAWRIQMPGTKLGGRPQTRGLQAPRGTRTPWCWGPAEKGSGETSVVRWPAAELSAERFLWPPGREHTCTDSFVLAVHAVSLLLGCWRSSGCTPNPDRCLSSLCCGRWLLNWQNHFQITFEPWKLPSSCLLAKASCSPDWTFSTFYLRQLYFLITWGKQKLLE